MIFYFSGTGNTLWAMRKIAQITNEHFFSIPTEIDGECRYTIQENERIGFIFPVHGWRPPIIMRKFIKKMVILSDNLQSHYCYALCTAGDDVGMTMEYLNKDLAEKGLHTHSTFSLKMPESYVGLPFMDIDKKETEFEKKREAVTMLQDYAEKIYNRERGIDLLHRSHWPRINSKIIGGIFVKWLITDKPFHVDADKCVKCGICSNVCPVNDIDGGFGKMPQWKHNGTCLTCFACYHHCPHHAIEYGKTTRGKGQYYFK
jgi:NAD-dependent dihydropyrimidine dehydrogenase PreA subunit